MRVLLERHYGYLFEPELLDEIEAAGKCKLIKQGERLLDIGQDITVMPLIFSGAIKILREDDGTFKTIQGHRRPRDPLFH